MRHRLAPRASSPNMLTWRLLAAAALILVATPAWSQKDDPCKGRWVRSLGGAHAVSKVPLKNVADLQKRLPELEAGMRDVIARDGAIGAGTADALFDQIRAGKVTERTLGRDEKLLWMVYQPKPGQIELIKPPCVDLKKDYAAFEIEVVVPEPMSTAVSAEAGCSITATRNCEAQNPTITVDVTGSSANARVMHEGAAVSGTGTRYTVADATPCSEDETFTVNAQGLGTASRKARVYKFLIPKLCSNLTYLAETESQTLTDAAAPKSCEKSVTVAQCKPGAEISVDPTEVEVHNPATIHTTGGWTDCTTSLSAACAGEMEPITLDIAGNTAFTPGYVCCDGFDFVYATKNAAGAGSEAAAKLSVRMHDWVFRGSLAYIMPTDGEISRDFATLPPFGLAAHEEFEVEGDLGVSLALERRYNEKWGLEFGTIFGQARAEYGLSVGNQSGGWELHPKFYAATIGPNWHVLGCSNVDFYLGALIGYGGFYDPDFWALGHRFHADFDGTFLWGAQLGIDVPFQRTSDWGFHGGVRYLVFDQDTDAGSIDIDPLVFEAGVAYHF